MKKCTKCGFMNEDANSFCEHCGNRLSIQNEVESTPKKSKNGLFIAIIVFCILVICCGGGALFYFQKVNHDQEITALQQEKEEKEKELQEVQDAYDEQKKKSESENKVTKKQETKDEEETTNQSTTNTYDRYIANYNMKVRSSASYTATQVGSVKKGEYVSINEIVAGPSNSYWGRISEGHWICVSDPSYTYLSLV